MIGDAGVVITLHLKNKIESKLFIDEFNEDVKIDVKNLFYKNPEIPIYIVIDSIDQIYKKKTYPPLRKNDLAKLVHRDIKSESNDKESFRDFIVHSCKTLSLKKNHISKSEVITISSSVSSEIKNWIEFLIEMPNEIKGIFMSPVESVNYIKKLESSNQIAKNKKSKKFDNEEKIHFLVLFNKTSGTRQIIYNKYGIIFTRLINYNFGSEDFIYKFEQDVFSTFEYLKRIIPDIRAADTEIITILPENAAEKINKNQNFAIKLTNYTPSSFAKKIGCQNLIAENSKFCDVLTSIIFLNSKKILKFSTPKIKILSQSFLFFKSSKIVNSFISIILVIYFFKSFFIESENSKRLANSEQIRLSSMKMLSNIRLPNRDSENLITENGNPLTIEKIIDFGKIHELLGEKEMKFKESYFGLKYLKKNDVIITNFSFGFNSYSDNSPKVEEEDRVFFKGNLINASGDIEDVFKSFDKLTNATKKNFPNYSVKYNDIPRNIDFIKKYYNFPIEFTLTKK